MTTYEKKSSMHSVNAMTETHMIYYSFFIQFQTKLHQKHNTNIKTVVFLSLDFIYTKMALHNHAKLELHDFSTKYFHNKPQQTGHLSMRCLIYKVMGKYFKILKLRKPNLKTCILTISSFSGQLSLNKL